MESHGSRTSRRIPLSPDAPVNVGRSSRSEVKNLSAADDNALFDCPVISRKHAELELKLNHWTEQKQQITLKDTRSMHGTSVNGTKLMPGKPFQLRVGDTIRLGDNVHRADSASSVPSALASSHRAHGSTGSYDGIILVLDAITSAAPQPSTQVKSSQPGISCPSGSESEFEEDDNDSDHSEEAHDSSAHTTPDQAAAKDDAQSPPEPASSFSKVINLEDDKPVASASRPAFPYPLAIPDTYDNENVLEVKSANRGDALKSSLSQSAFDVESDDDDMASRGLGDSWSDESDYGEHLYSDGDEEEVPPTTSFRSFGGDSQDLVDQADQDDDEGPEVMSSKRDPSKELESLNDGSEHIAQDDANVRGKSHYDPVRGFQVPTKHTDASTGENTIRASTSTSRPYDHHPRFASANDTFADVHHSSRWDIGPDGATTYGVNGGPATRNMPAAMQYQDSTTSWMSPQNAYDADSQAWPSLPWGQSSTYNAATESLLATSLMNPSTVAGETGQPVLSSSFGAACPYFTARSQPESSRPTPLATSNLKRTASEMAAINEIPVPVIPSQAFPPEASAQSSAQDKSIAIEDVPVPNTEPALKKRKIKQPRTKKGSIFKTAAAEAGKYAAGALVGGVGLVALLASPLGARLAEC